MLFSCEKEEKNEFKEEENNDVLFRFWTWDLTIGPVDASNAG